MAAARNQLDAVAQILTLVLHNQQHNALHEAATISRVLCTSNQLRSTMLAAAEGRLTVQWSMAAMRTASSHRKMMLWLQQHMRLRTLKWVKLAPELLAHPLHDVQQGAVQAHKVQPAVKTLCSRVACELGSAAAWHGVQLPKLEGWLGHDLPPASLSLLPGQHLTQLVLGVTALTPAIVQELSALTSLHELRLPLLCPAPATLAPALSALTRLTGLLLFCPVQQVLAAIPASTQQLVLARSHQLPALHLGHLTNLQRLQLCGPDMLERVQDQDAMDLLARMGFMAEEPQDIEHAGSLQDSAVLPPSLRQLTVEDVLDAAPLLPLPQLGCLQLTSLQQWRTPGDRMLQLSRLTQLTRLEVVPPEVSLTLQEVLDLRQQYSRLPLHVPSLTVSIPTTGGESDSALKKQLGALGSLSGLTELRLVRQRPCRSAAILTAAAAAGGNGVGEGSWRGTVQQLAGVVSQHTNLCRLGCKRVPAMAEGASTVAEGADWLPLMSAAAALPRLGELQLEGMPLGASLAALAAAQHLTSLSIVDCQLSASLAVPLLTALGRGSKRLQLLELVTSSPTVAAAGADHQEGDAVLTAVVEALPQLTSLRVEGWRCSMKAVFRLKGLSQLTFLHLGGAPMGFFGLERLAMLTPLSAVAVE